MRQKYLFVDRRMFLLYFWIGNPKTLFKRKRAVFACFFEKNYKST